MAVAAQTLASLLLLSAAVLAGHFRSAAAAEIGVSYGLLGNNLPPASEVIALYKRYGIRHMRLFNPNHDALEALRGTAISAAIGVPDEELQGLASDRERVKQWFDQHIAPYVESVPIPYITVGNEVIPGELGQYVLPVMESLQALIDEKGYTAIKATTVVPGNALAVSYPPSSGRFTDEAARDMRGVLQFLSSHNAPLLINVYPYFAYASDPADISLDYALFTATSPVVVDRGLSYYNLFDAMVDAFLWAMEGSGGAGVNVVVSETGWPSSGNGGFTTADHAGTYNRNFKNRIESNAGTPKRPGAAIRGYIFAMFNENQKPGGVEQNFGLFYPNMSPVYPCF